MSKTTNNIGQICMHKEFERFKSFHELFKEYMKKGDLPSKQFEKLFEDINDFETAIVPIAKKVGIDLSKHIDTVGEMWEYPKLTHPEVTCAGWSGDRVEEAIESECCQYKAKLQDRKAAIADLDKVMVALYASQPKDKNHGPIFNIQNSNVILGNVRQPGNVRVGNHTQIQEQMKNNSLKDEISSRINVLCSDLRNFRADFIRGAVVFGSCQANNIPDKFKPKDKDLPNNIECGLRISFGTKQHKFYFFKRTGHENYNWLINNTGLEDYINMLGDIWPEGGYSWLIEKPEHIELLNQKADHIYELSEPLLRIKKYRSNANKVRAIVRYNGSRWTDKSNVECSYLEKIENIVKEFESAVAQQPAEPEQNTTVAKCRRIWTCVKRIPRWIYVLVLFLAALLGILEKLGCLDPIERLFAR